MQIFGRLDTELHAASAMAHALFPRARASCAEKPAELFELLAT